MPSITSIQAAKDFNCEEKLIETEMNDDKTVSARGCDKEGNYKCAWFGPWHKSAKVKCEQM